MATAMQTSTRANTPARWQAALRRALDEGIEIRQLAGCGMWVATSSSQTGVAYEVTWTGCECHAGQHDDPVCKHRTALRMRFGGIVLPEPEPPTPAAPALVVVRIAEQPCHSCGGHGQVCAENRDGWIERMTCWMCDGTGVEPVTAVAA